MSARNIAQLFETCRECGQKLPRAILAKFHGPSRPLLRQGSTWDRGMIKIRKRRGNGLLLAASSARAPPKATASQRLLRSSHCERVRPCGGSEAATVKHPGWKDHWGPKSDGRVAETAWERDESTHSPSPHGDRARGFDQPRAGYSISSLGTGNM